MRSYARTTSLSSAWSVSTFGHVKKTKPPDRSGCGGSFTCRSALFARFALFALAAQAVAVAAESAVVIWRWSSDAGGGGTVLGRSFGTYHPGAVGDAGPCDGVTPCRLSPETFLS